MDRGAVRTRRRRRSTFAFLLALLLAVWVGGSVMTDFVVVPHAFSALDRNDAIDYGAEIFRRWNFTECLFGALAFLFAFAVSTRGWGSRRRQVLACAFTGGMTLIALVFLFGLTPAIIAKVEALRGMGVDLADLSRRPPERETLNAIHTFYAGLDVLKILLGTAVLWLLATRGDR